MGGQIRVDEAPTTTSLAPKTGEAGQGRAAVPVEADAIVISCPPSWSNSRPHAVRLIPTA